MKWLRSSFYVLALFSMALLYSLLVFKESHQRSVCSCDYCQLQQFQPRDDVEEIFTDQTTPQVTLLAKGMVKSGDDGPIEVGETGDTDWDASYSLSDYIHAKFDHFCYKPKPPYFDVTKSSNNLLPSRLLKERGCKQRLPTVIMPGARKCGTGTLMRFLYAHPNITGPPGEIHYFSSRKPTNLTHYRSKMPFTTPHQITMEKTPTYFYRPFNTPQLIKRELSPMTKIIIVLCSPVRRAVSDYLEFLWRDARQHDEIRYNGVKETFERTIDDASMLNGGIRELQELIDVGIYIKHLIRWYDVFPRDQILLLDGTGLSNDPFPVMQQVEKFLGLRSFYRREHFSYNEERGLSCIEFPSNHCMSKAKGRTHPEVNATTWQNLCDFYAPFDRALVEMTGYNFTWVGQCPEQY